MKTTVRIAEIIVLICLTMYSCQEELKDPNQSLPQISTTNVSLTDYTSAILGGIATNDGGTPIISRGVCWNTKGTPTLSDSKTLDGFGTGIFVSTLTGLIPSTKYFVRSYITNSLDTIYGNEITFTTSQLLFPSFSKTTISACTYNLTVVCSEITADNGSPVTARGVCWNMRGTPTLSDNKTVDGSGVGAFTSNISNLVPNVTYFVRTYATNSTGTSYGEMVVFTTNNTFFPILSKTVVESLSMNSAILSSGVLSDNGDPVSARGVCWNITGTPTIAGNKTSDGSGVGAYSSNISGLQPSTVYYIRAYATNGAGTAYGDEITITLSLPGDIIFNPTLTYGTLSDIDGNAYKTIQIGTQTWMAENLKTTRFNDGKSIPLVRDNADWDKLNTPAYCWYNNDEATYKNTYGALYNWFTVTTGKLCPVGWHVPSIEEWRILQNFLGGEYKAGDKLKETGTTHWQSPNAGATNESGFTAIPAGVRYNGVDYGFWGSKIASHMYSSDYLPVDNYWDMLVHYNYAYFDLDWEDIHNGCSVRCLKN